mgnify:CR=1 FL=1
MIIIVVINCAKHNNMSQDKINSAEIEAVSDGGSDVPDSGPSSDLDQVSNSDNGEEQNDNMDVEDEQNNNNDEGSSE